jgi:uncharacterized membrane protein
VQARSRRTWHQRHRAEMTLGERVADMTAHTIGSWPFIIAQSIFVGLWIALNLAAWVKRWDPYPFILLNLAFSVQAAYAAPIIMMSQNRQAERDRIQAQADLDTNVKAEAEIEDVQETLARIEQALARLEHS